MEESVESVFRGHSSAVVLFPQLSHGKVKLDLVACVMKPSFFEALAGRAHGLRKLAFSHCCEYFPAVEDFSHGILPLLSGLPLTHLWLNLEGSNLPCEVLGGLKQLTELHIDDAMMICFEDLLPQLPCLST